MKQIMDKFIIKPLQWRKYKTPSKTRPFLQCYEAKVKTYDPKKEWRGRWITPRMIIKYSVFQYKDGSIRWFWSTDNGFYSGCGTPFPCSSIEEGKKEVKKAHERFLSNFINGLS